jgi:hypothetical protein
MNRLIEIQIMMFMTRSSFLITVYVLVMVFASLPLSTRYQFP